MRSDLESNKSRDVEHFTMLLGTEEKALSGDFVIADDAIMGHIFDPNGSDRIITLPTHRRGRLIVISNSGTANSLTVKNASAVTVATVYFGETQFFFGTTSGWVSTPDVFSPAGANASTGLVPTPPAVGGAVGSERYLCEDGTWRNPGFAGNNAYATISDGTNTATASGSDNIKFRTANNILAIVVTDNDATHGDNALFTITEGNINHNALLNYVANQHIDHTAVSILTPANGGLAGGGTIAASRSLTLDINNLTADTPVLADSFAFLDASGGDTNKATLTTLNGILDHNALLNYVADQHVAHSGVSIAGGAGLTGGGTIEASRTISLDITGQDSQTPALADEIIYYDVSGLDFDKCTFTMLNGVLDHNSLLNYVAAQHKLHPASTDNALARYDSTAGDLQNSGIICDDSNNLSGIVNATMTGYLDISEIAAPANPAANVARFYCKDNGSGTTKIYFRDSAGTETEIGSGGGVSDPITITNTDAGAGSGPTINLDRNSASPAASDVLGIINFLGRDSGAVSTTYANISALITDPTDGSEDGSLRTQLMSAGTLTTRMSLSSIGQLSLVTAVAIGLHISGTPSASAGMIHIRPDSGSAGYISWTENGVADRGAIGFDAASGTLKYRTGNASGTSLFEINNTGNCVLSSSSSASSTLRVNQSDAGAFGPSITTYHNSASSAIGDRIFQFSAFFNSSTGVARTAFDWYGVIDDPTNASEDITVQWFTIQAGTVTMLMELNNTIDFNAGFGYNANNGAGGTVTQATSKSTGVTLNTWNGEITLNGAALAANTTVTFTLTNSKITASDKIIFQHQSVGTAGAYHFNAQCAAGSATINVRNITSGSLSEAIVVSFSVIRGSTN